MEFRSLTVSRLRRKHRASAVTTSEPKGLSVTTRGHYKRMGVCLETLGRIKKALAEVGVKDKQMKGTLGGMLRVVHEMKCEGDDYENL